GVFPVALSRWSRCETWRLLAACKRFTLSRSSSNRIRQRPEDPSRSIAHVGTRQFPALWRKQQSDNDPKTEPSNKTFHDSLPCLRSMWYFARGVNLPTSVGKIRAKAGCAT